eukprot:CAMPEP_0177700096 /NCGR_PEP_ID=MMETSP0484_2-20121128/5921_1 /TAXON_ID=354590 /ORGANISM="Rhodomonas lens, Strain RHODO" /LENGTH=174 /DNA_ID=CAMNT_0019211291 /DNA_START=49 /DNA_END=576 /DNA_ORIENTATION=-
MIQVKSGTVEVTAENEDGHTRRIKGPQAETLRRGNQTQEQQVWFDASWACGVECKHAGTRTQVLEHEATFGDLLIGSSDSHQAATTTSVEFCQLQKLDRGDLEEALLAFPEMPTIIASQAAAALASFQALAYCLSNGAMCFALAGIGAAATDRSGRRMPRNRIEIDPGMALYAE